MQIDVSGHNFVFPNQCACCGAPPQMAFTVIASRSTGKRVIHTTSKSWDFPYCAECVRHVRAAKGAKLTTVAIVLGSFFAAGLAFVVSPQNISPSIMVLFLGIGLSIFTWNKLISTAKRMMIPGCVSLWRAVGYFGWQGSCHKFDITSQKYALAFMLANQKKLVNVPPNIWQWLQANGAGGPPDRPQSARKYVT